MVFEKITELCKKNNTSIAGLEKAVGLANATIRKWENSAPTVNNLKLVADYFGVTVDELLSEGS